MNNLSVSDKRAWLWGIAIARDVEEATLMTNLAGMRAELVNWLPGLEPLSENITHN